MASSAKLQLQYYRGIYAISCPSVFAPHLNFEPILNAMLESGIGIFQFRDKVHSNGQKFELAKRIQACCREFNALFIINDDPLLCRAVDADGVHLGLSDPDHQSTRALLGPDKIIGLTCHNQPKLARQAQSCGADYIGVGSYFSSSTKPELERLTSEQLREIQSDVHIPIVAIGGINRHNLSEVINAGITIAAMISDLYHHNFSTTYYEQLMSPFRQQGVLL